MADRRLRLKLSDDLERFVASSAYDAPMLVIQALALLKDISEARRDEGLKTGLFRIDGKDAVLVREIAGTLS